MNVDLSKLQIVLNRNVPAHQILRSPIFVSGWTVATCGCALLAVKSSDPGTGPLPRKSVLDQIRKYLSRRIPEATFPMLYLREIAIAPGILTLCNKCGSTGTISCKSCGGDEAVCELCSQPQPCASCHGTGDQECDCGNTPKARRITQLAYIDGVLFDRELIGEYLYAVTAEGFGFVVPRDENSPLILGAEDWRLFVMPVSGQIELSKERSGRNRSTARRKEVLHFSLKAMVQVRV